MRLGSKKLVDPVSPYSGTVAKGSEPSRQPYRQQLGRSVRADSAASLRTRCFCSSTAGVFIPLSFRRLLRRSVRNVARCWTDRGSSEAREPHCGAPTLQTVWLTSSPRGKKPKGARSEALATERLVTMPSADQQNSRGRRTLRCPRARAFSEVS